MDMCITKSKGKSLIPICLSLGYASKFPSCLPHFYLYSAKFSLFQPHTLFSLLCTPHTNTAWYINYTAIKKTQSLKKEKKQGFLRWSSWNEVIRVVPNPVWQCPSNEGKCCHRDRDARRRHVKSNQSQEHRSGTPMAASKPWKLGEGQGTDSPSRPWEGSSPAGPLLGDFQPPELFMTLCYSSHRKLIRAITRAKTFQPQKKKKLCCCSSPPLKTPSNSGIFSQFCPRSDVLFLHYVAPLAWKMNI